MVLCDDILLHLILYISEAKQTNEQRNKKNKTGKQKQHVHVFLPLHATIHTCYVIYIYI